MAMGPSGVGSALPKFTLLDDLAQDKTSALVVEKKKSDAGGQFIATHTTGFMAFKSGVNRVFHFKSDSDKAANQASLQHLLDYIGSKAGARVASDVRTSDVFDRAMRRGTYVSSELVSKIRDVAADAAQKQLDDGNFDTFANFLDRGRKVDAGGDHVQFTEAATNGLMDLVDDLATGTRQSEGDRWPADKFPKAYAKMTDVLREATAESRVGQIARVHVMDQEINSEGEFVYGPDHPLMQGIKKVEDPLIRGLAAKLHETTEKATERGQHVTEGMLAGTAAKYLARRDVMGSFVRDANVIEMKRLRQDPEALAEVVRQLEDDADHGKLPGIRKEDVTWLADQLEQDAEVEMPIPQLRGRRSEREAQWPMEVFQPKEIRDHFNALIVNRLYAGPENRDTLAKPEYNDRLLKLTGQELSPRDFAAALTQPDQASGKPPILIQILQQRRAGLDAIGRHDALVRDQREKLVGSKVAQFTQLPSVPLSQSKAQALRVEDVAGFVKAVALEPIAQAKRVQLENAAGIGGADEAQVSRQVETETARWESRLDKVMPALDRFADLARRLDDIADNGGFNSLDRTMWKNIQDEAKSLLEATPQIRQLADDLYQEYGDVPVLDQLSAALESAAKQIESDVGPLTTLHDELSSSTNDRMFQHVAPLKALQQDQFASGMASLDGFFASLQADLAAIRDDLAAPEGGPAPQARPTQPATGHTPGETVINALGAAFQDAGRAKQLPPGAEDAFGKWTATAGGFIDRYAEFAVRHENDAQLRHLSPDERTEEESLQVTRFLKETVPMLDGVKGFANATAELRRAVGDHPPAELAKLLDTLDAAAGHMRDAMSARSLVRTSREHPFAVREDRLIHLDDKAVGRMSGLLANLSVRNDREEITRDALDTLAAVDQLKSFDRSLRALTYQNPVADRTGDRERLGAMDLRAERLERRAEGISRLIERIDTARAEVESDRALIPLYAARGGETPKAGALRELDAAKASLRLQLQTLRATVEDYRFYRGDADPMARHAAGLGIMSQAMTAGSAPRDGWARFGSNLFAGLIDSQLNAHGMPELDKAMGPGLAAIDKLGAFRTGLEATLGGNRQPTERELAVLHDGLAEMETARSDLADLRAHARTMERALTGGETFDEFMGHASFEAFQRLPGAQAWQNFETLLARADDEIGTAIGSARARIDLIEPPKPQPIVSSNPFDEVRPSYNPFDDVPPLGDAMGRLSTNPFDDLPPLGDATGRPSTNPFDDLPPSGTASTRPSTNPFDNLPPPGTTSGRPSTNPFD